MNKIRLLVWPDCPRQCIGCCNKDWNLADLPYCQPQDLKNAEMILVTGGEPLLYPTALYEIIKFVRKKSKAKIYVYTAHLIDCMAALRILKIADGMTVTLHTQSDLEPFLKFARMVEGMNKSLRLNVFRGVSFDKTLKEWNIKSDMIWLKECPLPKDEVFMQCDINLFR